MTALAKADIIGCGRPFSATEGHEAFGAYMADLAAAMPVTAKDLRYDRRTVDALGTDIAEGMKNLLARVQSGDLEMTRTACTGQRRGSESGTAMNKEPSMKVLHRRAWLFLCLILGAAAVVLLRLFWVQIVEHDRFSAWSLRQTRDMQELYSERGTIYDRGGKPLAFPSW